ncbi:GATA zinc finger [Phlyctema vagabunda]|uniref:GATA zinc finger n=1 Tax=Phlyctema vagabunda TaxID=108571 RepID=A0ABR4PTE2_9HELO
MQADVTMMNQFFGTQYSQEDLQQLLAQRRGRNGSTKPMGMPMPPPTPQRNEGSMHMVDFAGGDSLDDIIMQNSKELHRRQSYTRQPYGGDLARNDGQRSSMLEFGSSDNGLDGFQFGTSTVGAGDENMRRQLGNGMNMNGGYSDMNSDMNMSAQMGYDSSMRPTNSMHIDTNTFHGMSPDMVQTMMGYGTLNMDGVSEGEPTPINMFVPNNFFGNGSMEPLSSDFNMPQEQVANNQSQIQKSPEKSSELVSPRQGMNIESNMINSPTSMNINQNFDSPTSTSIPPPTFPRSTSYNMPGPVSEPAPAVSKPDDITSSEAKFRDVYSSSGFDMLKALTKVAARKDPEIDIGAVDMSCAFVVCDIKQADIPIVYVSDIFERLTGYNKHEVLGRNCRFLQSPHGKVQAGIKRTYVDDDSVKYLKDKIARNQEAQRSLINYRKGGQPFMNLLTMIPIAWDTDEIRYYIGFQVDLVEQPGSVAGKGAGGSYTVNYSQGLLPRYVWQPPENSRPQADAGQTISRDDVSAVLSSFNNSGESELAKRMWDKVLLENTDDVVHVLSLKGLFLYLSPSSRKVLEYDSSELVGTALSSICHPSDIVPVTRELKDTSTGVAVSVVFRIRRKNSGYTWFESHGALCVEQGKGRKCIILVGRERPVYALSRTDIEASGGFGENELWTKLSTSGMFLFVSTHVRALIDRQPDELVGTSIQAIMRPESKIDFGRALEKARTGKRVVFKHEILNKRGLVLQAQTTLYPGDAAEGTKPTFLVAQTRFLKSASRSAPSGISQPSSVGASTSFPRDFSEVRSPRSITGPVTEAGGSGLPIGTQDIALASDENIFDELKTTRCTSWQFELRQMEKSNRILAEELASLLSSKKKRQRQNGEEAPVDKEIFVTVVGFGMLNSSTRGGDAGSTFSSGSPQQKSPLRKEVSQSNTILAGSSLKTNNTSPSSGGGANGGGEGGGGGASSSTTVKPSTNHTPSQGFNEGGDRRITNIIEEG